MVEVVEKEVYSQPLLTRHTPLLALTGKSAEKDPQEKTSDKITDVA